jgi:hypothetical protein
MTRESLRNAADLPREGMRWQRSVLRLGLVGAEYSKKQAHDSGRKNPHPEREAGFGESRSGGATDALGGRPTDALDGGMLDRAFGASA